MINSIQFAGRLGADPETRFLPSGASQELDQPGDRGLLLECEAAAVWR